MHQSAGLIGGGPWADRPEPCAHELRRRHLAARSAQRSPASRRSPPLGFLTTDNLQIAPGVKAMPGR